MSFEAILGLAGKFDFSSLIISKQVYFTPRSVEILSSISQDQMDRGSREFLKFLE